MEIIKIIMYKFVKIPTANYKKKFLTKFKLKSSQKDQNALSQKYIVHLGKLTSFQN